MNFVIRKLKFSEITCEKFGKYCDTSYCHVTTVRN